MNEELEMKLIWDMWLPGAQVAYETAVELGEVRYTAVLADMWKLANKNKELT